MNKSEIELKELDREFRKNLGKRIAEIRKSRGKKFTQEYIANEIGISLPSMGHIEIGANYPKSINLIKTATVLDVDAKDFFDFPDSRGCVKNYNPLIREIHKDLEDFENNMELLALVSSMIKKLKPQK